MISGFLTSVISSPAITYRGTPYVKRYWFLPSSTPAFSSEAFDKQTNPEVSTDVADKHARYIMNYVVGESREGHEWISKAIMALCCVDYCFHQRTAIISAAKVHHCKPQGLPRCLVPLQNGGQQVMFFWHLHVFTPNKGICYLIRIRSITDRTRNQAYCV